MFVCETEGLQVFMCVCVCVCLCVRQGICRCACVCVCVVCVCVCVVYSELLAHETFTIPMRKSGIRGDSNPRTPAHRFGALSSEPSAILSSITL